MKFTLLVNGEPVAVENDVKIIVEGLETSFGSVELHYTFTDEGRIVDLVQDGEVRGTNSCTYEEQAEGLDE